MYNVNTMRCDMKKSKKKNTVILLLNVIIPILLGTIIYYFLSPDVLFVKRIDQLLGNGFHISYMGTECLIWKFIRNYFLDMLWGYALIFGLFLVSGNNIADLKKIFLTAFLFSAVMEILQMTPVARGTFDIFDILVEFLAEIAAVFIIKILLSIIPIEHEI